MRQACCFRREIRECGNTDDERTRTDREEIFGQRGDHRDDAVRRRGRCGEKRERQNERDEPTETKEHSRTSLPKRGLHASRTVGFTVAPRWKTRSRSR